MRHAAARGPRGHARTPARPASASAASAARHWPTRSSPSGAASQPPRPPSVRDITAYTPRHLVEKILTSRTAIEGERKIVTVMFSDVSGFTAMSEKLDPEDVHASWIAPSR